MEFRGIATLFEKYKQEVDACNRRALSKTYFQKMWQLVMRRGVIDPEDGVHYRCYTKTTYSREFAKCTTCEILLAKIRLASCKTIRAALTQKFRDHMDGRDADRFETARVSR